MKNIRKNESGLAHLIVLAAATLIVVGAMGYRVYLSARSTDQPVLSNEEPKLAEHGAENPELVPQQTPEATALPPEQSKTPVTSKPPEPAQPPTFTPPIEIRGDVACQTTTLEALELLKNDAPTHYSVVISYVGVIECGAEGSGMFAYEDPPRYLVGDATRNAGTVWYAGTIVHDAGHSKLYHDYMTANPGASVPADEWSGEQAEAACLASQHDALVEIGATQSQIDYIQGVINTDYWDIPYEDRWW